jgi:hypothetical protein
MTAAATPADLVITPRNLRFGREEKRGRWWLKDDPFGSAWHNSLSLTFPLGEGFFIDSVRPFRDQVPPQLAAQIDAFVRQEAYHTREHVAFNNQVKDAGYDVAAIETRLRESLDETRTQHPVAQLCITVSLEHFTAIFAHQMLKDSSVFAAASEEARSMWTWHAIEEVEHKAVAFDTYMYVTRDLKPWKRWLIRSNVFWKVSRDFVTNRSADALRLLAQDGIKGPRARLKLFWYLVGKPGPLRRVFPMWLSYFRPGFHPWMHDDRHLIAKAEAALKADPA